MAAAIVLPFALTSPRNATANKLIESDQPAHRWYRFVLSYPPHLVRNYLERFGCDWRSQILDPFAGTGTTLVEAKKSGIRSIGVEALPMAHFASRVKLDWSPDSTELKDEMRMICRSVRREFSRADLRDDGEDSLPKSAVLKFKPEQAAILLGNSISPIPLHKTLILKRYILRSGKPHLIPHMMLALAKSTVFSASNLHFGPEVGVRNVKRDAPVLSPWIDEVQAICQDLSVLDGARKAQSRVYRFDSRQSLTALVAEKSIDAVITSPPYPNEKDYTRTTRLESVLLDFITNKSELRLLKKGLVRSNTRSVYRDDDDDKWIADIPEIGAISQEIEERRILLGKTSGFERQYARVTKLYFGGMARHLSELRTLLKPGAHLAYVVGDQASYLQVFIPTGRILAQIAERLGYEVVAIDLFRTRLATATKRQMREEVIVLRAPNV